MTGVRKVTTVVLVAGDDRRQFPIVVAQKLLAMKSNGGWVLPENSEWIYDADNGTLNRRTNRRTTAETDAQGGAGQGEE